MKKNLFFVSAITIATLASCSQESMLDPTVVSVQNSQTPIEFSTYASTATATRGTAVNSNGDFQTVHGEFEVTSLITDATFKFVYDNDSHQYTDYTATPATGSAVKYFDFINVEYLDSKWKNANQMYWPNDSKIMHFAAYSPTSADISSEYTFTTTTGGSGNYTRSFSFPYSVTDEIGDQVDLMYAMTDVEYISPIDRLNKNDLSYVTEGTYYTNDEESVNLHFKHALTQIAFTATKDADIDVYVHGITICNVYNSGVFTATVLTDDDDADTDTNTTVGDSKLDDDTAETDDLVNANNFGKWVTSFDADGWGTLTADPDKATTSYNFYYVEAGSGGHASMSHYEATLTAFNEKSPATSGSALNAIKIGEDVTALTSSTEVLMLMPQQLTAWTPTTSTALNCVGFSGIDEGFESLVTTYDGVYASSTAEKSLSYLVIDCEIYHSGITDGDAKIHDGYIFVPFETKDIAYKTASVDNSIANADEWLAGYKITYCLNFGGGYVVEEGHGEVIPEPGCVPDTETYTLRTITYTTSVDTWIDIAESQDLMDFENGEDTDTSYDEK